MSATAVSPNFLPEYGYGKGEDLNCLLNDLHKEIESLKYKNSELLFQLYVNSACECRNTKSLDSNDKLAAVEELQQFMHDVTELKDLRKKYELEMAKNSQLVKEIDELKNPKPTETIVNAQGKSPLMSALAKSLPINQSRSFPEIQVKKKVQIFEQKSKSDISTFKPIAKTRNSSREDANKSKITITNTTTSTSSRPVRAISPQELKKQNTKPVPASRVAFLGKMKKN